MRDYSRKLHEAQPAPRATPGGPARGRAYWAILVNTLIVGGGYLLSRVLGLVRSVIISNAFGTSPYLDAYQAAFKIPDLIYLVVAGGALGSAFIPVFSALLTEQREEDAWRLASSVLNIALVALVIACSLIALFAGPLVALTIGSGFTPEKRLLTVQLVRLLLIQPFLLGIGGLAKATLESFDRFALPAIGSNLYNIGIIAGALLLAPLLGIHGLVWGVIGGAALFLLVQLPGLWRVGLRYTATLGLDMPGVHRVGRLLAPRLFGQSAFQINLIAIASFASTLGDGAVSANDYAFQLMVLPHGLIALSLGTVIFPQLARHYAAGDTVALRSAMLGAVRVVLFLALPAAVLLGVLRLPILRVLFQRGAFDAASAALSAQALAFYALGLVGFAVAEIVVRTFYAMHDTRTPVLVGTGAVAINIALAWALLPLGLGGLALAFSSATTIETVALLALIRRRIGGLGPAFWRALAAMGLSTLVSGAVLLAALRLSQPMLPFLQPGDTYRWPGDFGPLVLWLLALAGGSGSIYCGTAALLGVEEVRVVLSRLIGRLRRTRDEIE